MTKRALKTVVGIMLAIAFVSPCGIAAELPANTWVRISDGAIKDGPQGIYAKPILAGDSGRAVLWFAPGGKYCTFSAVSREWAQVTAEFPPGHQLGAPFSPLEGTYLPGLKKVLFMFPSSEVFSKKPAVTWLLDPVAAKWEVQSFDLRMGDSDTDFNPLAMRPAARVPLWGDLIYDPVNKEAVAFGGTVDFGRVGREKEPVKPGDWIYDESSTPKRLRRLLDVDSGKITDARKWYSGHSGTWTFSEETGKWSPTSQPMHEQPPGRILSQMAYDSSEKKIVLFGGDDLTRCLNDTWIYDCASRTWKAVHTDVAPPARAAHALVYVPEAKALILAGGYGGGWRKLKDVWIYNVAKNQWTRLATELPETVQYCAGYYDPQTEATVVVTAPGVKRNGKWPVYAMRLDLASAAKAEPENTDPNMNYHCKAWNNSQTTMLPDEWLKGKGAPEDRDEVLARLKTLPANQWVNMKPPYRPDQRGWGSYVYDVKTHRAFAWGGGHSAYPGDDVSEYDLTINRWYGQKNPPNFYPISEHGRPVGITGVTFFGTSLLPCHARRAFGIDPLSRSLILWPGDVYDLGQHCVVSHIGPCPPVKEKEHPLAQPAYVSTDHGLYAVYNGNGQLYKADVPAGVWKQWAAGGPTAKSEWAHLSWDSKRDRLIYMDGKNPGVFAYSFGDKTWKKEDVQGGDLPSAVPDSTYVAPMDAILLICAEGGKDSKELMYFYKLDECKWYTAPIAGDAFAGVNTGLNHSPFYDSELGLVIRVSKSGNWACDVHVMRLEPEDLKLTPVKN